MDTERAVGTAVGTGVGLLVGLVVATLLFSGCAGTQVQIGPCSKYPCEWSKPVVKGAVPKLPKPDYSESVKMFLCLEPTRQYPIMLERTCI